MKKFFIFGLLAAILLWGCGYKDEAAEKKPLVRAEAVDTGTVLITVGFIQTGKEGISTFCLKESNKIKHKVVMEIYQISGLFCVFIKR